MERWLGAAAAYAERLDPFTALRGEVAGHMAKREQPSAELAADDLTQLARANLNRRTEVHTAVAALQCAQEIRAHVSAMREVPVKYGVTLNEGSSLDQLLAWASDYADRIDPVVSLRADAARVAAQRMSQRHSECASAATSPAPGVMA